MVTIRRVLLLMMVMVGVAMSVTLRGERLGHTSVVLDIGFETHALELQPVVNYFEFVDTRFQTSKLLFEFLSRHGRGWLCARRRGSIWIDSRYWGLRLSTDNG